MGVIKVKFPLTSLYLQVLKHVVEGIGFEPM